MKSVFIILIFCFAISSEIKEKAVSAIQSFYVNDIEIIDKTFKISKKVKHEIQNQVRQKFFRDKINYWIIEKDGKVIGYAILDNSKGKSMPITYLVIFNLNQEVIYSEIIKYREAYGGEVGGKRWLAQFSGMKKDSLYTFPEDIAGISGATISVRSVTKGFSKLSLLLPHIIRENKDEN